MNTIENDRGEFVVAVGAPGSQMDMLNRYPSLIENINLNWCVDKESYETLYRALVTERQFTKMEICNLFLNTKFKDFV